MKHTMYFQSNSQLTTVYLWLSLLLPRLLCETWVSLHLYANVVFLLYVTQSIPVDLQFFKPSTESLDIL